MQNDRTEKMSLLKLLVADTVIAIRSSIKKQQRDLSLITIGHAGCFRCTCSDLLRVRLMLHLDMPTVCIARHLFFLLHFLSTETNN